MRNRIGLQTEKKNFRFVRCLKTSKNVFLGGAPNFFGPKISQPLTVLIEGQKEGWLTKSTVNLEKPSLGSVWKRLIFTILSGKKKVMGWRQSTALFCLSIFHDGTRKGSKKNPYIPSKGKRTNTVSQEEGGGEANCSVKGASETLKF